MENAHIITDMLGGLFIYDSSAFFISFPMQQNARVFTIKIEILQLSKEDWQLDGSHFLILLNMGLPMGLQYSITAIGSVILQTAINGLGVDGLWNIQLLQCRKR